jgi:hypothetical protein
MCTSNKLPLVHGLGERKKKKKEEHDAATHVLLEEHHANEPHSQSQVNLLINGGILISCNILLRSGIKE